MEIGFYYDDKNRPYKDYNYYNQVEDNCVYSRLLFHKVEWRICDKPDITKLQDNWAEDIIQSIIDGFSQGDFGVVIVLENGEEEDAWLDWKIMTAWSGES